MNTMSKYIFPITIILLDIGAGGSGLRNAPRNGKSCILDSGRCSQYSCNMSMNVNSRILQRGESL